MKRWRELSTEKKLLIVFLLTCTFVLEYASVAPLKAMIKYPELFRQPNLFLQNTSGQSRVLPTVVQTALHLLHKHDVKEFSGDEQWQVEPAHFLRLKTSAYPRLYQPTAKYRLFLTSSGDDFSRADCTPLESFESVTLAHCP